MEKSEKSYPLTRAAKSSHDEQLRVQMRRFAMDLDSAVRRLDYAEQQLAGGNRGRWSGVAYWQTAVVKIARWFLSEQEGLHFDPWDYIEQDQRDTMHLVLRIRSEWLTRKTTEEVVYELVLVDEDSFKIIPTDVSIAEATAVMEGGRRVALVTPETNHVGKVAGTSFGIWYMKKESLPVREVCDLIRRIRDRVKERHSGG